VILRTAGGLEEADAGCIYDFDEGRSTVLVGFGGLFVAELLGFGDVEPAPATVPFEFFNIVSALPVGKVFVRDLDQIFYQKGVRGLGRTVGEVCDGLRNLLSGAERVVFVGQSSGGYAAILYGCLMGVDEVLAFSPQTFLTRTQRRLHHDNRWPDLIAQINRLHPVRRHHLDLRKVLRRHASPTRVSIYFGAKNGDDRAHARRLEGLPNVTLHPWATASHAVARRMREEGVLRPVLLEALT
jgi:hypothetical protein